jgi:ribonuclease BN (tRNA processing enzyme)
MIFAPRSCPSSPGFAMTTRIFRATGDQYMAMKLNVIGSSPAWPNPGGAHSGYLLEGNGDRLLLDCGPGVLSRLREAEGWPRVDAIAITHFHLDHWGDLVPWVWGSMYRARNDDVGRPTVWVYEGGHDYLEKLGSRLGFPDMFDRVFDVNEYAADRPFTAAGFEVTPVRLPHYTLETYGFRVARDEVVLAYSGDSGPSDALVDLAREADLFVCEATLERAELDGQPRGHLDLDETLEAFSRSGARRLLVTHRPAELSMPDELESAYDGLELTVEPRAARSAGSSR